MIDKDGFLAAHAVEFKVNFLTSVLFGIQH